MASPKPKSTIAKFIDNAAKTPDPEPVNIQPNLVPAKPVAEPEKKAPTPRRPRPDRDDKVRIMVHVEPELHELLKRAGRRVDRPIGSMLKRLLVKIASEYDEDTGHRYLD